MSYILSLETATPTCSVALHHDDSLLAEQGFHLDKSHSSILHPLVRDMLSYCDVLPHQLSAVAISQGPGSYTGLRIGASAAKGFCYALDIPLIAVDTLEAMAWSVQKYNIQEAWLCPMLDARRMEVYCQVRSADFIELMPTQPFIVDEQSFRNDLQNNSIIFFGSGSDKCQNLISSPRALFIKDIKPSASSVGDLAISKFRQEKFEDVAYFVPNYLKEFRTTKPKKK